MLELIHDKFYTEQCFSFKVFVNACSYSLRYHPIKLNRMEKHMFLFAYLSAKGNNPF